MSAFRYKTLQDIQGQLVNVLGSMSALGSPLGFVKKVGGGVTDLFYEPLQGAVHSPQDFIKGIGKGTSSLASNVISGAFDSVADIVGTASKGIGYLSGDGDYVSTLSYFSLCCYSLMICLVMLMRSILT